MKDAFIPAKRRGAHWKLVRKAIECLRTTRFPTTNVRKERTIEASVVGALETIPDIRKHFFSQLRNDPIEKVAHAEVLGFRHRPDAAIGVDGTAFEIKMVTSGQPLREAIGQSLTYRVAYRFVILCLVDKSRKGELVEMAADPERPGHRLLRGLADRNNIFTVVGPRKDTKSRSRNAYDNVIFI